MIALKTLDKSCSVQFFAPLFLALLFFSSAACVSVDVVPKGPRRSAHAVRYTPPPNPFIRIRNPHADMTWENPQTGGSISFQSDCSESGQIPLDQAFIAMTKDLNELQIRDRQSLNYNSRAALRTTFVSLVDGLPVQVSALLLNKNSCAYVLTYVSAPNVFAQDLDAFENFLREFRAP